MKRFYSSKHYPLHVHISMLFTLMILVAGGLIGGISYYQTRNIILNATDHLFRQTNKQMVGELEKLYRPIETFVNLFSHQDIIHAKNLSEHQLALPFIQEAFEQHTHLSSIYVGHEDGRFFLVRPLRTPALRKQFNAPTEARYLVQSIDYKEGKRDACFLFLDRSLTLLKKEIPKDYTYDPRTRPWYQTSLRTDNLARTDPYVFFTTKEVGKTFSIRSADGKAVVGADLTLYEISTALAKQKPTLGSQIVLFEQNGRTIAYQEPLKLLLAGEGDDLKLAHLNQLGHAVLDRLFEKFTQPSLAIENQALEVEGRIWRVMIQKISIEHEASNYLAIAAPEDELLSDARKMRTQTLLITLGILLITIPVTWLIAWRVASSLRRLQYEAEAIQRFEFNTYSLPDSFITEINELSSALLQMRSTIASFLEISSKLAAEKDFEILLKSIVQEMVSAVGASSGKIYLSDALPEDKKHPVCLAAEQGKVFSSQEEGIAVPLKNSDKMLVGVLWMVCPPHVFNHPNTLSFILALPGASALSLENQRLIKGQKELLEALIRLIASAIDAKSPYTGGHCQRVPVLTQLLAEAAVNQKEGIFAHFQMSESDWESLSIASWLHDCGKLATPDYVIDKATKLETLYDRIHEIRMRFEVLKRDAEIKYWQKLYEGGDRTLLIEQLYADHQQLDEEFAFVAACNRGEERMTEDRLNRLSEIAKRTWVRTLSDRIGLSYEEHARKNIQPEPSLPVIERLLEDKPDQCIAHTQELDQKLDFKTLGFKMSPPAYQYNRGELYNLSISSGTLTAEERYQINAHMIYTLMMLNQLPFPPHLKEVPEIAGGHHEKMNGLGYPKGLVREEMSVLARMMAIADIFEALTAADRPYKQAKTLSQSIQIMNRMKKEGHLDPDLFELFLTSGVYLRYAENFLTPDQIDFVAIHLYVKNPT